MAHMPCERQRFGKQMSSAWHEFEMRHEARKKKEKINTPTFVLCLTGRLRFYVDE